MKKKHTILMIASARTGSTRLTALLSQFSHINALGELVHPRSTDPRSDFNCGEILRRAGKIQGQDPKEAWAYCRSSTAEALSIVHESNGNTNVVKLAPGHLPDEDVKKLFKDSICGLMFLSRNPIDSYVSLQKAMQTHVWDGADTSDMQLTLDAVKFVKYCQRIKKHNQMCALLARQNAIPAVLISYETTLNIPDSAAKVALLKKLETLGCASEIDQQSQGSTADTNRELTRSLFKQDRNQDYNEKIINWEQFTHELASLNKLHLLRDL